MGIKGYIADKKKLIDRALDRSLPSIKEKPKGRISSRGVYLLTHLSVVEQ